MMRRSMMCRLGGVMVAAAASTGVMEVTAQSDVAIETDVATVAAPSRGLRLEAISAFGVGETAYEISASEGGTSIRSRLEFPLDGVYVGADGSVVLGVGRDGNGITLGAKFLTNMTDPDDDMKDYDWVNGSLVGDTSSEAEASSMILDLYTKWPLVSRSDLDSRGFLGFRHETYDFDIYGAEGAYAPPIGDGPVFISTDTLVLTYEMTHDWIYGGLEGQINMTDTVVALGSAVAGFGAIEDRDNHVLRDKISTGELVSVSGKATAHLIWYLSPPTATTRFYLKGGAEAMAMVASGDQNQTTRGTYYDYRFYDIDDEIEMTLITANAIVGCDF